MKILADECIPTDLILALRQQGFDLITSKEAKLTAASDETVFAYCLKHKLVLLTLDRGFGDIFRFDHAKGYGVVVVLIKNMSREEVTGVTASFFNKFTDLKGKVAVIGKTKIRISER